MKTYFKVDIEKIQLEDVIMVNVDFANEWAKLHSCFFLARVISVNLKNNTIEVMFVNDLHMNILRFPAGDCYKIS